MSSRAMILEKLRAAGSPERTNREVIPRTEIRRGDAGVFIEKATAAAAQVIKTTTDNVPQAVKDILAEIGCRSLLLSDESIIREFQIEVIAGDMGIASQFTGELRLEEYRRKIFQVDVGISGCDFALADSGSIVIKHDGEKQRLLSLAPDYYIALVKTSQLLGDRFDLALLLEKDKTAAVTLITGVSRTADVALQVVLGMHGPRKVYILLIED